MAELNFHGRITDRTSGVAKKSIFLLGAHKAEKIARLRIVIIVLAMIPVVSGAFQAEGRFGKIRLLLPLAVTVGFVTKCAAMIAVYPHGTVPVLTVKWAAGGIDRNQVVVYAEPVQLGIMVGKKTSLQHFIR